MKDLDNKNNDSVKLRQLFNVALTPNKLSVTLSNGQSVGTTPDDNEPKNQRLKKTAHHQRTKTHQDLP